MKSIRKHLVAASLLAAFGIGAIAQPQPPVPAQPPARSGPMMGGEHGRFGPAQMQERKARREAQLKQKLQITPAQESAWNNWTQAMRPAGNRPQRPNFVEFARLTTPERIDRMRALRAQRNAQMDRRADATKAFYAQLSREQQKTFDEQSFRMFGHGGRGGRGHHGHHKG